MPVIQRRRFPLHLDDTWCLPGERWKPIPDWVDYYEASDYGRVRSLARGCWSEGRGYWRVPACVLQQLRHQARSMARVYFVVNLYQEGEVKKERVHRLVLFAFVGPCPSGYEAMHRNGDSQDNRLENLVWGTSVGNTRDQRRHGTAQQGEKGPNAKLTEAQVYVMRQSFARGGITRKQLACDYDVSSRTVADILRRSTWGHLEERDDGKAPELEPGGRKRRLTTEDVREAERRIEQGESVRSIAEGFGVCRDTLYRARRRAGVV